MHNGFASAFYRSQPWIKCRTAYRESRGNLCERCLAKGIINAGTKDDPLEVHHKIKLTPENINDPAVSLNWDNLELLCKQCHIDEHFAWKRRRWRYDRDGVLHLNPDDTP